MRERLMELRDAEYAAFQAKLTPTVDEKLFIGVRVPKLRALAKQMAGTAQAKAFLDDLPHTYYDENMLHGLLICEEKEFDTCLALLEKFLPYIDNWAVCDTLSPKIFQKNKTRLLEYIPDWMTSGQTYTCRFGIGMLMRHFLDGDFNPQYLQWVAGVKSEEYYINMMIAWYFATALAKQWDAALPYIQKRKLPPWVHSKTIQKALESCRVSPEHKQLLRTLK